MAVENSSLAESCVIRTAVEADIPTLCRLAVELVGQHVAYDAARYQPPSDVAAAYTRLFGHHLARPESVLLVADTADEAVGYVFGVVEEPNLVSLTGRAGWVHDLYVSPMARGRGVGGRLLDAAVTALRRIGCPGGVLLGVAAQNQAAASLFRSRGFRPALQEMVLSS